MIIKTITCHDVYNVGASLQAYALQTYLTMQGHQVEIIDYKPDYLSHHYSLKYVANPNYNYPVLREVYLAAKLPERLIKLKSERKANFDRFKVENLKLTKRFNSYEELINDPPIADLYFAGSDQIWNPLFQNGKDPAFYLKFVKNSAIKASYAASFAVESMVSDDLIKISNMIRNVDFISVRERSALKLLKQMQLKGTVVCDPVFLLNENFWKKMAVLPEMKHYQFIYDFDNSEVIKDAAQVLKQRYGYNIISTFSSAISDRVFLNMGPLEFLGLLLHSDIVISNSFHATAFALIFHKDFFVLPRKEQINTRMEDLLAGVGLSDRLIECVDDVDKTREINWDEVDRKLNMLINHSKNYINSVINSAEKE